MNARSTALVIGSFLVLLITMLWLYLSLIVSNFAPALISSDLVQVDDLKVSSVSWRQTHIDHITGSVVLDSGRVRFTITDAVLAYQPTQLRPGAVNIREAEIEFTPADRQSAPGAANPLPLPPRVVVDKLHFKLNDGAGEFNGRFELTTSERNFSAFAVDDNLRLSLRGDAGLTKFQLTMEETDLTQIADVDIVLDGVEIAAVEGVIHLAPLADWLRQSRPLPGDLQGFMGDLTDVAGTVQGSARYDKMSGWKAQTQVDLHRLEVSGVYTSARLEGELGVTARGWEFRGSRPASLQANIPSYQLDGITSVSAELPAGYVIVHSYQGQQNLTGQGIAALQLHSDEADMSAQLVNWSLADWRTATLELQDLRLTSPYPASADRMESTLIITNTSPLLIKGDASMAGARMNDWHSDIPGLALNGEWNWNDRAFDIEGAARWNGTSIANWSLSSRGQSGAFRVGVEAPVDELIKPLKRFLKTARQDVELSDGTLRADLNWAWNDDLYDNNLKLVADGVDGRLLGLQVRDGAVNMSSSDLTVPSFHLEASLAKVTFANELTVTDLILGGRWQNGLYIDRAEMMMLGGTVSMTPAFFDLNRGSQDIKLEIKEIDLAQLLSIAEQEGLSGRGLLSGTIPLRLIGTEMAIEDGYLKNDTTGTLGYDAGDGVSTQIDNIALQALKDFRYDVLDINLSYQTRGDYAIHARLEGRNPDLYNGYPIAFNINLTGSLPGLLRASLITGDFHSEILKNIEEKNEQ